MSSEYNKHSDKYELLGFNKWNNRLLNLYRVCNVIVLVIKIAFFYYFYKTDSFMFSIEYLFRIILIPTALTFGVTALCEFVVFLLKEKHNNLISYVMTFACVIQCSILFMIHYGIAVLSATYIIPIMIALIYSNKNVLRATFFCSFAAFIITCLAILNFGETHVMKIHAWEIATAFALLIITYMLCRTMLNRNSEITNTLSVQNTNNINGKIIDINMGIENSAGSEELHKKMLMRFLENGREAYNRLEKAIAMGSYGIAHQIVHIERGTANIIGAVRLVKVFDDLDDSVKNGAEMDYNIIMSDYSKELDIVLEYIKSINL